jgi:hypothetical protein
MKRSLFHGIRIVAPPLSKQDAVERSEPVRSRIRHIAEKAGAKVIDPVESLCPQGICPALSADGAPLYNDYDHLSLYSLLHRVRYLDFIGQPSAPR